MKKMRRRDFIASAATAAAVTGLCGPVSGQANAVVPGKRIVVFHPSEPPAGISINGRRGFQAYFGELQRRGYIEGRNLIVERYSGLGHPDQFEPLAREIVATRPDAIVCVSGFLARLVKANTATIPILATSADPIAGGLVTNLARPGGNISGVSADAGLELNGKRLQYLAEVVPNLSNVRVFGPAQVALTKQTLAIVQDAARLRRLTIALAEWEKIDAGILQRMFDTMTTAQVNGLIVSDTPEHLTYRQEIVDRAAKHRIPAIYPFREFVEVGGLLSYGIDTSDMMHRLAQMTDEVLKGIKPGEIPFQQQTKIELLLNRTAARALGLEFPPSLVAGADEVID